MKKKNIQIKFKSGTIVVFDPDSFGMGYWDTLTKKQKTEWYGWAKTSKKKWKFFVFLCEIKQNPGHCVLVSLDGKKIEVGVHTDELREVTIEEI